MNVVGNKTYTYENTQQTDVRKYIRNCDSNWKSVGEEIFGKGLEQPLHTEEITVQDAYERMCAAARTVPEATQVTWTEQTETVECAEQITHTEEAIQTAYAEEMKQTEKELHTNQVKQESQTNETRTEKVIEMSVVTLSNGISFEFNDQTGEVNCIDCNDKGPGKRILWSKTLSEEELAKSDNLFENYADMSAGYFVFQYESYLPFEKFWDGYLDGKIDLTTLKQGGDLWL